MMKNLLFLGCLLLSCFTASAQKVITGKILDETGDVLPGVNILLKGTTMGTVSGANGTYSVSVPDDQANNGVLVFSFIGYTDQEHIIGNRTSIDVTLSPDIQTLNEVVVVGYGTMKREDISGAVSSVQTKDLPKVANTSIDQLLQGRVAGLNMAQRSAQPGGGLNINIRGAISPQGSNQPLYVIDGVPIFNNSSPEQNLTGGGQLGYGGGVDRNPLNSINPSDIESIDVLKDASASAIYGSSAANGVVLITTKRGKSGPAQVEYRASYTIQTPKEYIDLFGPQEFMLQHNRLAHDRYLYLNNLGPYGTTDPASVDPFVPTFSNFEIQSITGKGTDWLDLLMRNGKIHEHNISVSGGTENTKYYSAFNIFDNEAILENSNLRRYTGRVNVDQKLGKRVNLGLNLTGSQITNKNISSGGNSGGTEKYNMLQAAYAYSPTVGTFDENGAYMKSFNRLITNPAAFLIMDDNSVTRRIMASPNLEVKIVDALKLNIVGGIDHQNSQRDFYIPKAVDNFNFPNGAAQKYNSNIGNYSSEAYLTFMKASGGNNLNVVLGAGIYRNVTSNFGVEAVDFFTDALNGDNIGIATGKDLSSFISNRTERNRQSLFSRINYSYQDKYILTLSGRYDGDSEFAANKKFGFFPGASLAWRISGEDFLSSSSFISDLKLRVGYGQAGNPLNAGSAIQTLGLNPDAQVQNRFNYPIGGVVYSGVTVLQLANPNLTWETNETINLGLDFGMWEGRVSGALDIYQRTAKDLLDFNQLPYNNAIGQVSTNIGTTRSQGVELSITSVNLKGPLSWSTTFTATTFKSFWVDRNQSRPLNPWVKKNDPIGAVYGWKTDGIIQSVDEIPDYMTDANYEPEERVGNARPGNIRYVDHNGDGKLNGDDVVMLGQRAPKWNMSLANTLSFKNFDLNFFFYAMMGNIASINSIGQFNTASPGDRLAASDTQNTPEDVRRVWTADNPEGDWPGLAQNSYSGKNPATNNGFDNHDFYAQKADFIRLKNITLGYNFSKDLLGGNIIRSARIFVDVQNLAKFTKFDGFDPEFTEINPYPQAVSTTLGVNIGF
jgi:TonB-dependent starch-binding outer membrane protein SusC